MTPAQQAAFAAACVLTGLSKGGLGGPLPIALIMPLLSLVMDPREGVALITPFLIFADWFALAMYWNKWDTRLIRLMLPAALVGIVMGGLLLTVIPSALLKAIIAIFTLLVIAYKLVSDRLQHIKYKHQTWHGYLAGWASGFASTLANSGAPPFTTYMLLQRVPAIAFIGTSTLFFAIVNLLKIPIFLQNGLLDMNRVWTIVWVLPIVPLAVYIGRKALNYIDQQTFERLILTLLFMTSIFLLVTL